MPLEIIRNDIAKVYADAIVNPTNSYLKMGGNGVSGAILKAAGKIKLQNECDKIGYCDVGNAKITKAYNLNAKYIIHTVGPVWKDGKSGEEKVLSDCYKNSLKLTEQYSIKSIAFPLISSGNYGYPKDQAIKIAFSCFSEYLLQNEITIYLVIYDEQSLLVSEKIFNPIKEYINDNYITENELMHSAFPSSYVGSIFDVVNNKHKEMNTVLNNLDESFSQKLLKLIDKKGKSDVDVYKKANIDRRTFSKIRSDVNYKPSKSTALAFSIGLELNIEETNELLASAGYALSHSYKSDVIIEYHIKNKKYDIYDINIMLFSYNEKTLGA